MIRALELMRKCAELLKTGGIPEHEKEAQLFVVEASGISDLIIYRDDPELSKQQVARVMDMIGRRIDREPAAYILGYLDFLNLRLSIGPGALVPRPETEVLAALAVKMLAELAISTVLKVGGKVSVLDLCTGSGCLGLAIASQVPSAKVTASDLSPDALMIAKRNAELNEISNVDFICGDMFDALDELGEQKFDLIISNPPYIKRADIATLQPEITRWEPGMALDGGSSGLDFYREIIAKAADYLMPAGLVMLELGEGQIGELRAIIDESPLMVSGVIDDLQGIKRILVLALR